MNRSVCLQLLKFGIGLLIGSALLLGYAFRESRGAQEASEEPEEITLADLIARGPEGNPHVRVKDFVPCQNCVAIPNDEGDSFIAVYVPVIPGKLPAYTQPLPPGPDRVEALIKNRMIKQLPADLRFLRRPLGVTGMIVNGFDPPGSEDCKALEEKYPGIDLSRCIILHEDRKPERQDYIQFGFELGVILGLGGIILLGLAAVGWKRGPPPRRI